MTAQILSWKQAAIKSSVWLASWLLLSAAFLFSPLGMMVERFGDQLVLNMVLLAWLILFDVSAWVYRSWRVALTYTLIGVPLGFVCYVCLSLAMMGWSAK